MLVWCGVHAREQINGCFALVVLCCLAFAATLAGRLKGAVAQPVVARGGIGCMVGMGWTFSCNDYVAVEGRADRALNCNSVQQVYVPYCTKWHGINSNNLTGTITVCLI